MGSARPEDVAYAPSAAEQRLLLALPHDGTPMAAGGVAGFATAGEALRASGGPERHGLLAVTESVSVAFTLTAEGEDYRDRGLPERRAWQGLGKGAGIAELAATTGITPDEAKICIGWLKRKGWASIEQGKLVPAPEAPESPDEEMLARIGVSEPNDGDGETLAMLKERGLVKEEQTTAYTLSLTAEGQALVKTLDPEAMGEEVNQITPAFIARWAEMSEDDRANVHLRGFDFDVPVEVPAPGKAHPLTQMMQQIRSIFWQMGFQEISGDYVESAFWNMDALFIPQDHPAREMQDTFYLEHPRTAPVSDEDVARGKAVHEHGGDTGSTGWQTTFSEEVARQALLRTHTTNTTIRHLADHPTGPQKVFGLGRVFRKETMDATHLPEFTQIEGIVTEPGANFDMLVGLCRVFFAAVGFPEVRFRPAYFPYTEPSMEIDVMYNGKWMELGGCGVFRPEVTEPLGVESPVLAWGFGLERLAMMRLGLKDIRNLYISDIQWLQETQLG